MVKCVKIPSGLNVSDEYNTKIVVVIIFIIGKRIVCEFLRDLFRAQFTMVMSTIDKTFCVVVKRLFLWLDANRRGFERLLPIDCYLFEMILNFFRSVHNFLLILHAHFVRLEASNFDITRTNVVLCIHTYIHTYVSCVVPLATGYPISILFLFCNKIYTQRRFRRYDAMNRHFGVVLLDKSMRMQHYRSKHVFPKRKSL